MTCSLRTLLSAIVLVLTPLVSSVAPADDQGAEDPESPPPWQLIPLIEPGHGWAFVAIAQEEPEIDTPGADRADARDEWKTRAVLLHLPPRKGDDASGVTVDPGSVRVATRFNALPDRIAGLGRDAYAVFIDKEQARVLRARATVSPGGVWTTSGGERAAVAPTIPLGSAQLVGFCASGFGPTALSHTSEGDWTLWRMGAVEWQSHNLPQGFAPVGDRAWLVGDADGVTLAHTSGDGRLLTWRREGATQQWTQRTLELPGAGVDSPSRIRFVSRRGALFAIARVDGAWNCWALSESAARLIGSFAEPEASAQPVMFARSPRAALLWEPAETRAEPGQGAMLRSLEWSLENGAVLYEGPATRAPLVGASELRVLVLVFVAILIVLFLSAAKRPPPGEDAEPASRPARLTAGAADMFLAAAGGGFALSLAKLWADDALAGAPTTLEIVLWSLGVGWFVSTLFEWRAGASPGKHLVGLRCVGRGANGRPTLAQSVIRNTLKWALLPIVGALVATGVQPPGDALTGVRILGTPLKR